MLFIFIGDLGVDGCGKYIPLGLRESSSKSHHNFGSFRLYPVVVAVHIFGGVDVVFHDAIISEVCNEEFEGSTTILWAGVKRRSIFTHDVFTLDERWEE